MAEKACAAGCVHAIRDSDEPLLPLDKPEIETTCTLFTLEHLEVNMSIGLTEIIQSCLKDVKVMKQHNNAHTMKMLSQLIAVSEYIKLRAIYRSSKACKQPCLKASIAIACWVGRGVYYACHICHNELYLLKHHHLPPWKEYTWYGQYFLLDNKVVLNDMCVYLAAQSLGTVTPLDLCQHVNGILLPALGIKAMISESTAQ